MFKEFLHKVQNVEFSMVVLKELFVANVANVT